MAESRARHRVDRVRAMPWAAWRMKSRARKGLEPAKRGTDLVILVAPQAGRCM